MALLDFPSGPGTGDTYTLNGNMWKWNGTSWVAFNSLSLSSQVSGILAVQYGGTGFGGTYTAGDILYALSSNTFGKLTAGTAGSVLASGGPSTAPYWKVDDTGAGTVGSGTSGGFSYYTSTTNITSGSGFSYISGTNNVVLTNGLLSLTGSTVNSGTWAGNAITAKYGGTGLNTISAGDLIYGSANDTYGRLTHSATAGSILVTTASSGLAWTTGSSLTIGTATSSNYSNAVVTDAVTVTRYLVGTVLNTASTGGTVLSTGSGITIGNNLLTSAGIAVTGGTGSSNTTTGALVVTGGVGIGGSLWTNSSSYSSISGVAFQSGVVTSGVWAGTAVSLTYGGTNNNLAGTAQSYQLAFYNAAGNAITALSSSGVASSVLFQTNRESAPIWVGQSQLVVGGASTAANIQGGAGGSILYQTNASTTGFFSHSGTAGSILVTSGSSGFAWTTAGSLSVASAGLATSTSGKVNITNITGTGVSYLYFGDVVSGYATIGATADITVQASSGTIYAKFFSGTATSAAQVNTDNSASSSVRYLVGTVLNAASGSTQLSTGSGITFTNNLLTSAGIAVTGGTGSSNTTTGALVVTGGVGIGGSLWTATGNTSSISGIVHYNSAITGGTWAGTAVSLAYGGTNNNLAGTAQSYQLAFYNAAGTAITALSSSGVASSVLFQTNRESAPTWVSLGSIGVTSISPGNNIYVSGSTGSVTISNIGVTSVVANSSSISITASGTGGTGRITVDTAQNITTSGTPTFDTVSVRAGSLTTSSFNSATDIVNKQYVDNLASGLDIHGSVRAIAVSGLGVSYVQSSIGGSSDAISAYLISTANQALPNIDGVAFGSTGLTQRILVAGGIDGKVNIGGTGYQASTGISYLANGIYYVSNLGSISTNWILIRATDTDTNTELTAGTFTFVEEGTSYADTGWVCTNDTTNLGPIGFGITQINFSQFTGAAAFNIGQGLSKTGNYVSTKVNLTSTGSASGTGFTQFNIGGPAGGATGDTGYYPTFSVRTSSTIAGSATLALNNDGFSLIGSTGSYRTLTVTGGDITLNGGSNNTLTLTGNISLPSPQQYRLAYGLSGSAVSFLPVGGASSVLFQTNSSSDPTWVAQSTLVVGGASTAASIQGGAGGSILYQTGANTTGFFSHSGTAGSILVTSGSSGFAWTTAGSLSVASAGLATSTSGKVNITNITGTGVSYLYFGDVVSGYATIGATADITVQASSGTIYAKFFSGTATSAAQVNIAQSTATRYLIGVDSNASANSAQLSTGSGITIGNNLLTSAGIAVTGGTGSSNTTTGALVVTGGVGIGGSLWTNSSSYSSISGVAFQSGVVTSGVWAGTAVSLVYGGTNNNLAGTAQSYQLAFYNAAGTAITALSSSGVASSVLFQTNRESAPTWVGQSTLSVGFATSSTKVGITTSAADSSYPIAFAFDHQPYSALGSSTRLTYNPGTGKITNGIWAGTAVSLVYGGTNNNLAGTAQSYQLAFYNAAGTAITALSSSGVASSVLFHTNQQSAPTWVGQSTLSVGFATSSTKVGITTSAADSSYPIAFAFDHQPYSALGSSTLLTYNPGTGKITNGIWAGTAITTKYGGTGLDTVNANQVLIGSSTGNTWTAIGSTLMPVAYISDTAPAQPGGAIGVTQAGQLWWDSYFGVLKVYYADGTSNQWVDATPVLGSSGGGSSTKRSYVMTFGAGFTPSTGADTVQILIPYAPDNTSKYYYIKRLDYRANTAGTGVSFYIERFTGGNAAFDVSAGNRIHSASGASFVAASGLWITSYTQSSSGASFVSSSGIAGSILSGDYLRLNFSHINSAANMSVSMIIEEQ